MGCNFWDVALELCHTSKITLLFVTPKFYNPLLDITMYGIVAWRLLLSLNAVAHNFNKRHTKFVKLPHKSALFPVLMSYPLGHYRPCHKVQTCGYCTILLKVKQINEPCCKCNLFDVSKNSDWCSEVLCSDLKLWLIFQYLHGRIFNTLWFIFSMLNVSYSANPLLYKQHDKLLTVTNSGCVSDNSLHYVGNMNPHALITVY